MKDETGLAYNVRELDKVSLSSDKTSRRPWSISSLLHCFAGILLLLFALSHFAFLRISGDEGGFPNPVFPFFTNDNLYLFAAVLEGIVALICFKFHGRGKTNIYILTFIAMMLLYRWSFHFVGGSHCNCLGILGRLLHISKKGEQTIPNLVLCYLFFTTIPWIYSTFRRVFSRILWKFLLTLMVAVALRQTYGSQTIEVYGEYNVTAQNPETGKPYMDYRRVHAAFSASRSGNSWKISATNLDKDEMGQMWCDGTNTYALEGRSLDSSHTNVVFVSSSQIDLGSFSDDYLSMSLPWLTYCFSPKLVSNGMSGVVFSPMPWLHPRTGIGAYGYKSLFSPTEDGNFIKTLFEVRDPTLDVSTNEALLRPDYVYPDSVAGYNNAMKTLDFNKTIPDGWVEAQFECTDWYHTNNLSIPLKSDIQHFMFNGSRGGRPFQHPLFRGELKATSVILHGEQDGGFVPEVSRQTRVFDFRYHRANKTRIYRFAEYTLQRGEPWKPDNDPTLMAKAASYLKHGPRYGEFVTKKNYLAWILFGIVALIPVIVTLERKHKARRKVQK